MKQRMMYVVLVLLFLVAACSKQEEANQVSEPVATDEPEQEEIVKVDNTEEDRTKVTNSEPEFENIFPLTGIGTDEPVDQRAVAVMINNHPNARPQTGLQNADIVYEVLTEGDITRFLAFYQSEQPKKVGPVRSARKYFVELTRGYDGLYLYHGTYQILEDQLRSGLIDNISGSYHDNDRVLFERADFRNAPHDSYLLYENLFSVAQERYKYNMTKNISPLQFLSDEEINNLNGEKAEAVMITYSTSTYSSVEFIYDQENEKYQRYSGGEKTVDLETDIPIMVDNLLIVEMDHKVIDSKGRRDINLTSGGKGYLLQKGIVKEINWKNDNGRIIPYVNGEQVGFVPGKTWINIIPTSPGITSAVSLQVETN